LLERINENQKISDEFTLYKKLRNHYF